MELNFQVGQYVLERPLGEGGMGEVWLGRNRHLGTPVAIKFLNPAYAHSPEVQQRFLNEGRRQGLLNHPNIVKVYGFEVVDSRSFLILQYVDGGSLEDLLRRYGRIETGEALRIALSILSALDYAHEHAIVHRDIKPSNILLDSNGFPYLGDFGIVLATNEKRITRTGTTMGTAHYMSPEQITRPGSVDRRSDIYSFGCVLYEMLAGEPPFNPPGGSGEDTDFVIKMGHVQQLVPPLRPRNQTVPPPVEAVILRCLAKNPADRFATCREVRDALSAAAVSPGFVPPPVAPIPRSVTVIEPPAPVRKVSKTLPAAASIAVVFSLGALFSLSPEYAHESREVAALAMALVGFGALVGGSIQDRAGPRFVALTGALLAAIGFFFGRESLYVGHAVVAGIGTGLAYICAIVTIAKWFPERRALMTGWATAAFWIGSYLEQELALTFGRSSDAAALIAVLFCILLLAGAALLKSPPPDVVPPRSGDPALAGALRTGRFWLLWMMLFLGLCSAATIISVGSYRLMSAYAFSRSDALTILGLPSLIAVLWARLAAQIGAARVYLILFAVEALSAFLSLSTGDLLPAILLQLCYFGVLCVMPAFAAGLFGTKYMGRIYGFLLLAWSIASVVSFVLLEEVRGSNQRPLIAAIALVMSAALVLPRLASRLKPLP